MLARRSTSALQKNQRLNLKPKISLREVGPRDGLQMVKAILPTERKLQWCREAAAAGIREIEVTSFVPTHVVPQFGDATQVAQGALAMGTFTPAALVPNLKGAQRAFELGIPIVNYVMSASEAHNLANVRRTTDASLSEFATIVDERNRYKDRTIELVGCIATSFGCTIQGAVAESKVVDIARRYAEMGADGIVVADTVGYADPVRVRRLTNAVVSEVGRIPIACHFHDTRGLGLANVTAAVEAGIRAFDSSLGGLGGCPFAPGATGNIATEDTIFLLESLGFDTGIDIEAIFGLRKKLAAWLPSERFAGSLAVAGLPKTFRETAHAR